MYKRIVAHTGGHFNLSVPQYAICVCALHAPDRPGLLQKEILMQCYEPETTAGPLHKCLGISKPMLQRARMKTWVYRI